MPSMPSRMGTSMRKKDSTNSDGAAGGNAATRLIETVVEIVEFAKTHCREPKRIFGPKRDVGGGVLTDTHIALEFSFSQDREDTRWKLDREFGNRLKACIKPFQGVGERSETIRAGRGSLREAVIPLLHFEHSIQQILARKAIRGQLQWIRQGAPAAYVDNKTGEVTFALQYFREMEDMLHDDSAFDAAKTRGEQSNKPAVELVVELAFQRATLRTAKCKESFDLPSEGVARWLKVLAEHPDEWIRPADYETHGGVELDGVKPSDKLRSLKTACPKLAKLIEPSKHNGMRFNPALVAKSGRAP